jgi:hypothetical protein
MHKIEKWFSIVLGEVDMSDKRELRDLLRRVIIANGTIVQFIYDVARSNLSAEEAESFLEEVNAETLEADESGEDGWMDLDLSAQGSDKLH